MLKTAVAQLPLRRAIHLIAEHATALAVVAQLGGRLVLLLCCAIF